MGQPKQLLDYEGQKLIRVVTDRLLACRRFPTVVVLGAHAQAIVPYLQDPLLNVIQNLNWAEGMASSIRCGMEFLEQMGYDLDRVMLAVVDQPFVEVEDYWRLWELSDAHPEKVAAAHYVGQFGVPMVIPKQHFRALARLGGDQGARYLVRNLPEGEVLTLSLPKAALDWDSPEDVAGAV